MPLLALVGSTRGRAVEKAVTSCMSVFVSVTPAWYIGKAMNSTGPQCLLRAAMRGGVLRGLGFELGVASKVPAISDFDDDEGAEALVEGGRVRGGGVKYPSGVDKVRRCSMSNGVELLGFYV